MEPQQAPGGSWGPMVGPGGEKPSGVIPWRPAQWVAVPIIKRLVRRFLLSDFQLLKDSLLLIRTIQPVTQVDDLLAEVKLAQGTFNLETGHGDVEVPSGKRWRILGVKRPSTTGVSSLRAYDGTVEHLLTPDGTTQELWKGGNDFIFPEGWILRLAQTSNAADAAKVMSYWYKEEEAY